MRNNLIILLVTMIIVSCGAQSGTEAGKTEVKLEDMTKEQKASYSYGLLVAEQIKRGGFELDADLIGKAIQDVLNGNDQLFTSAEAQTTFQAYAEGVQAKQAVTQNAKGQENKATGEAFLAENKGKDGVITTASGLQYVIMKEGTGAKPGPTDKVKTHYHGTLIDGTVFDSSVDRGQPISFPVNGVIAGWTEALQLMPVGSKWKLFIPSELAYGARGAGAMIGPNSALVFEVELLDIE